jgi:hypothetical protein
MQSTRQQAQTNPTKLRKQKKPKAESAPRKAHWKRLKNKHNNCISVMSERKTKQSKQMGRDENLGFVPFSNTPAWAKWNYEKLKAKARQKQ